MMRQIISCYSYTGGTGCTTGLMSLAHLLAEKYKVLVVDMNLQSPGINYYCDKFDDLSGYIDLIYDYKEFMRYYRNEEECKTGFERFVNCSGYIIPITNNIDYLPTGKQDKDYLEKVHTFDWDNFYKHWYGYGLHEAIKEKWKEKYDYILIDSGKGIPGSIAISQLTEQIVCFIAYNNKSLIGSKRVLNTIVSNSYEFNRSGIPKIHIVPSKIDFNKDTQEYRLKTIDILNPYIPGLTYYDQLKYINSHTLTYNFNLSNGNHIISNENGYFQNIVCENIVYNIIHEGYKV